MTPDAATAAFRFGFGLPLPDAAPRTAEAMLMALKAPDAMAARFPGLTMAAMLPEMKAAHSSLKAHRRTTGADSEAARQEYKAHLNTLADMALSATRATFARALDAPDGFRERLAMFWADHFTTTATGRRDIGLPSAMLDEAIRPNMTRRFADLLLAATTHPAMLIYLDQTRSFGPNSRIGKKKNKGLNENLARELLELHSMGVGSGYTQTDVTQMAELLTGLVMGKDGFRFDKRRAEPGAETVLGKDYGGDSWAQVLEMLEDLSLRPETAGHIAHKLAVHFVADQPDPDLVSAITTAYSASKGDLLSVYSALLSHPAAWATSAQKARQPFEFLVASLRALGLSGADVLAMDEGAFRRLVLLRLTEMGQPWQAPRGPDGWPEAPEAWITPPGLAARLTWAMEVPGQLTKPLPRPEILLERALGPRASAALNWAVPKSESQTEGIGLIFASPEFNRR
jgi:uncharacterized protein (DUF1800 family)